MGVGVVPWLAIALGLLLMGSWHRENPELVGTGSDPWMIHDSYRKAVLQVELECAQCGEFKKGVQDGLCPKCWGEQ